MYSQRTFAMPLSLRALRQPHFRVFALLCGGLLCGVLLAVGQAQVTTTIRPDGTLGTAVTQHGTVYDITGGTRPGNGPNLFHSFDRFSVGTNDTARFSGLPGIANILSRVTGGEQSVIDGRLQSMIPGANLYLLNPSGVLFGPNASLDLRGSFHVSTADFLRFADGALFSAHVGEKSTLTVAPLAAFGFLGNTPAAISIQESELRVREGKALSFVGGDIEIGPFGSLVAPGGRIQLVSVASPGEVGFSPLEPAPNLQVDTFARLGRIALSGAFLDTSGNNSIGGGMVVIRGGRLTVESSSMFADTQNLDGAEIGIDIAGVEDIRVANSFITTDSFGAGNAGDIRLVARSVALTEGTQFRSRTEGVGSAGMVMVAATEALTMAGHDPAGFESGLFSETVGPGAAGAVMVHAGRITMREEATIASNTHGAGPGGSVTINATSLELDQGFIQAQAAKTSVGDAGAIAVTAESVTLTGGAQISSGTHGPGRGGTVRVSAVEVLIIAGHGPEGPSFPSGVFGNAEGPGPDPAGTVVVHADRVIIREGGAIASNTRGAGPGGSVMINATTLEMESGLIEAQNAEGSSGDAGAIVVTARNITLTGGARINSTTLGTGRGGSITVSATDVVAISGHDSGLFTNTAGQGPGGEIVLQARQVQLTDSAVISAKSSGDSNARAGNVTITADDTLLMRGQSAITTEARQADGGNIQVAAQTLIRLRDSQITTAVGSGEGRGGNITIDPEFVILENSQMTANAFGGPGGNITIRAGVFLADPDSRVTASSARNVPGEINIQAPITALSGGGVPLPQTFGAAEALLRDQCAARLREGTVSSLVERGRDGVPGTPDGILPSRLPPAESPDAGRLPRTTRVAPPGVRQPAPPRPSQGSGGSARTVSARPLPLDCAR
jgi:filamentous hemagglutinin family protein